MDNTSKEILNSPEYMARIALLFKQIIRIIKTQNKKHGVFTHSKEFYMVLARYVTLECNVLFSSPTERLIKVHIQKRLVSSFTSLLYDTNGRLTRNIRSCRSAALLNTLFIFTLVSKEYKECYDYFESMAVIIIKELNMMGDFIKLIAEQECFSVQKMLRLPHFRVIYRFFRKCNKLILSDSSSTNHIQPAGVTDADDADSDFEDDSPIFNVPQNINGLMLKPRQDKSFIYFLDALATPAVDRLKTRSRFLVRSSISVNNIKATRRHTQQADSLREVLSNFNASNNRNTELAAILQMDLNKSQPQNLLNQSLDSFNRDLECTMLKTKILMPQESTIEDMIESAPSFESTLSEDYLLTTYLTHEMELDIAHAYTVHVSLPSFCIEPIVMQDISETTQPLIPVCLPSGFVAIELVQNAYHYPPKIDNIKYELPCSIFIFDLLDTVPLPNFKPLSSDKASSLTQANEYCTSNITNTNFSFGFNSVESKYLPDVCTERTLPLLQPITKRYFAVQNHHFGLPLVTSTISQLYPNVSAIYSKEFQFNFPETLVIPKMPSTLKLPVVSEEIAFDNVDQTSHIFGFQVSAIVPQKVFVKHIEHPTACSNQIHIFHSLTIHVDCLEAKNVVRAILIEHENYINCIQDEVNQVNVFRAPLSVCQEILHNSIRRTANTIKSKALYIENLGLCSFQENKEVTIASAPIQQTLTRIVSFDINGRGIIDTHQSKQYFEIEDASKALLRESDANKAYLLHLAASKKCENDNTNSLSCIEENVLNEPDLRSVVLYSLDVETSPLEVDKGLLQVGSLQGSALKNLTEHGHRNTELLVEETVLEKGTKALKHAKQRTDGFLELSKPNNDVLRNMEFFRTEEPLFEMAKDILLSDNDKKTVLNNISEYTLNSCVGESVKYLDIKSPSNNVMCSLNTPQGLLEIKDVKNSGDNLQAVLLENGDGNHDKRITKMILPKNMSILGNEETILSIAPNQDSSAMFQDRSQVKSCPVKISLNLLPIKTCHLLFNKKGLVYSEPNVGKDKANLQDNTISYDSDSNLEVEGEQFELSPIVNQIISMLESSTDRSVNDNLDLFATVATKCRKIVTPVSAKEKRSNSKCKLWQTKEATGQNVDIFNEDTLDEGIVLIKHCRQDINTIITVCCTPTNDTTISSMPLPVLGSENLSQCEEMKLKNIPFKKRKSYRESDEVESSFVETAIGTVLKPNKRRKKSKVVDGYRRLTRSITAHLKSIDLPPSPTHTSPRSLRSRSSGTLDDADADELVYSITEEYEALKNQWATEKVKRKSTESSEPAKKIKTDNIENVKSVIKGPTETMKEGELLSPDFEINIQPLPITSTEKCKNGSDHYLDENKYDTTENKDKPRRNNKKVGNETCEMLMDPQLLKNIYDTASTNSPQKTGIEVSVQDQDVYTKCEATEKSFEKKRNAACKYETHNKKFKIELPHKVADVSDKVESVILKNKTKTANFQETPSIMVLDNHCEVQIKTKEDDIKMDSNPSQFDPIIGKNSVVPCSVPNKPLESFDELFLSMSPREIDTYNLTNIETNQKGALNQICESSPKSEYVSTSEFDLSFEKFEVSNTFKGDLGNFPTLEIEQSSSAQFTPLTGNDHAVTSKDLQVEEVLISSQVEYEGSINALPVVHFDQALQEEIRVTTSPPTHLLEDVEMDEDYVPYSATEQMSEPKIKLSKLETPMFSSRARNISMHPNYGKTGMKIIVERISPHLNDDEFESINLNQRDASEFESGDIFDRMPANHFGSDNFNIINEILRDDFSESVIVQMVDESKTILEGLVCENDVETDKKLSAFADEYSKNDKLKIVDSKLLQENTLQLLTTVLAMEVRKIIPEKNAEMNDTQTNACVRCSDMCLCKDDILQSFEAPVAFSDFGNEAENGNDFANINFACVSDIVKPKALSTLDGNHRTRKNTPKKCILMKTYENQSYWEEGISKKTVLFRDRKRKYNDNEQVADAKVATVAPTKQLAEVIPIKKVRFNEKQIPEHPFQLIHEHNDRMFGGGTRSLYEDSKLKTLRQTKKLTLAERWRNLQKIKNTTYDEFFQSCKRMEEYQFRKRQIEHILGERDKNGIKPKVEIKYYAQSILIYQLNLLYEYKITILRPLLSSVSLCENNLQTNKIIKIKPLIVQLIQKDFMEGIYHFINNDSLSLLHRFTPREDCQNSSLAQKIKTKGRADFTSIEKLLQATPIYERCYSPIQDDMYPAVQVYVHADMNMSTTQVKVSVPTQVSMTVPTQVNISGSTQVNISVPAYPNIAGPTTQVNISVPVPMNRAGVSNHEAGASVKVNNTCVSITDTFLNILTPPINTAESSRDPPESSADPPESSFDQREQFSNLERTDEFCEYKSPSSIYTKPAIEISTPVYDCSHYAVNSSKDGSGKSRRPLTGMFGPAFSTSISTTHSHTDRLPRRFSYSIDMSRSSGNMRRLPIGISRPSVDMSRTNLDKSMARTVTNRFLKPEVDSYRTNINNPQLEPSVGTCLPVIPVRPNVITSTSLKSNVQPFFRNNEQFPINYTRTKSDFNHPLRADTRTSNVCIVNPICRNLQPSTETNRPTNNNVLSPRGRSLVSTTVPQAAPTPAKHICPSCCTPKICSFHSCMSLFAEDCDPSMIYPIFLLKGNKSMMTVLPYKPYNLLHLKNGEIVIMAHITKPLAVKQILPELHPNMYKTHYIPSNIRSSVHKKFQVLRTSTYSRLTPKPKIFMSYPPLVMLKAFSYKKNKCPDLAWLAKIESQMPEALDPRNVFNDQK